MWLSPAAFWPWPVHFGQGQGQRHATPWSKNCLVTTAASALREKIDSSDLDCELSVDGGITSETAQSAIAAGADVLVAGSAIFRSPLGIGPAVAGLWSVGSHQSEQQ